MFVSSPLFSSLLLSSLLLSSPLLSSPLHLDGRFDGMDRVIGFALHLDDDGSGRCSNIMDQVVVIAGTWLFF